MNIEYIKKNYKFVTLTKEHDLSKFNCESEDLNNYLKKDALIQQEAKLNVTKLILCDNETIGFVSLLTDAMRIKLMDDEIEKEKIKSKLDISGNNFLPAVKIGRFAIDKKYAGKGLGTYFLRSIISNIKKIAKNDVGLRFIVVEGYASAFSFYVVHNNFKYLKKDSELIKKIDIIKKRDPTRTFYLYYDLKKIGLK